ncbi:AlpA family phage regulatory protein [Paraburkholderia sp. UYCP14C]|uniref:helix-turn-helix transcriptional regulator n=1 Tax=Paraburkholderia sp. UYCP14C TaxID=2511130 RepID=UPI0010204FC2|nr:AlpA family phage regulatory protein [Paraburkholderia sp. UYCP14C]RZF24014.1 AlpA family phage regulatory protein [Paraburkholderia sp. UYCP14C]
MSGTNQLLRLPAVVAAVGLSKSSIYNLIRSGQFPRPVVLRVRAVAWRLEDVNAFIALRRPAGEAAK